MDKKSLDLFVEEVNKWVDPKVCPNCGSKSIHISYMGGLRPSNPDKLCLPYEEYSCWKCKYTWNSK